MKFVFTKITSDVRLTKELLIEDDQVKVISSSHLNDGQLELMSCSNLFEFNRVIQSLTPYECLVYGITDFEQARIVSRKKFHDIDNRENVATRTLDDFNWSSNRRNLAY